MLQDAEKLASLHPVMQAAVKEAKYELQLEKENKLFECERRQAAEAKMAGMEEEMEAMQAE